MYFRNKRKMDERIQINKSKIRKYPQTQKRIINIMKQTQTKIDFVKSK